MKILHRLINKLGMLLLLALLFCGAVMTTALAETKVRLEYKIYLGNADTTTKDSLKEKKIDLITFFSPKNDYNYYFVIPGRWNCAKLRIFMTGTDYVTINGKRFNNGDELSLSPNKQVTLRPKKGTTIRLTAIKTGGLPTLFIRTKSGSSTKIHEDKTYKESGTLYMMNADGSTVYNGKLTAIRTRGNSTFKYDKKPYQIKLEKSTALVGDKKEKTFILLANTLDRSEIRNTLALALARYSGAYSFVPASQSVDLYLNYDYKGTYLLTEKVEVDKDRLNITNLEKATEKLNPKLNFDKLKPIGSDEYKAGAKKYYSIPNVPKDTTGGYLIQSNVETRYATEASAFVTKLGFPFTLQEPKYINKTEINYLSKLFQSIEDALANKKGVDPTTKKHYSQLIDMNTLVHRYLQAEVLDDFDGQRSYFYKDSNAVDPLVYVGPVWDQDNILGASIKRTDASLINISSDTSRPYYWFTLATKQGDFRYAAIKAYQNTYAKALNILLGKKKDEKGILKSIDEYADEVRKSAQADLTRWPISVRNTYTNFNTESGRNFDGQIAYLKKYITQRKKALDKYFATSKLKGLTPRPTAKPTKTPQPTQEPTEAPTAVPTQTPLPQATLLPEITTTPNAEITQRLPTVPEPTETPTAVPTATPAPTEAPTAVPTAEPAPEATDVPQKATPKPTKKATATPKPTKKPTATFSPKSIYKKLQAGTAHAAVYQLRVRLYQLGYLQSAGNSEKEKYYTYDQTMVQAVKSLQKANGLKQDGIATPELQALIYSDQVKVPKGQKGHATAKPTVTPKPVGPSKKAIEAANVPELDAEGFLSTKSEFVYQDTTNGVWYYISNDLYVEILRYKQSKPKLIWYETHVKMRNKQAPTAIFSDKNKLGSNLERPPEEIARYTKSVLAISDDYYQYRRNARNVGLIIRNGKTLFNKLDNSNALKTFPRMDVMAFLPDGSMRVYERGTVTVSQLKELGVKNSYSFGPVLVKNGVASPTGLYGPTGLQMNPEPRNAIGMLAKNDYLFITVDGRYSGSVGVNTNWLTLKFMEKGVVNAFNLDGGGTTALVFMGKQINKAGNTVRFIPSMISFGTSNKVKSK